MSECSLCCHSHFVRSVKRRNMVKDVSLSQRFALIFYIMKNTDLPFLLGWTSNSAAVALLTYAQSPWPTNNFLYDWSKPKVLLFLPDVLRAKNNKMVSFDRLYKKIIGGSISSPPCWAACPCIFGLGMFWTFNSFGRFLWFKVISSHRKLHSTVIKKLCNLFSERHEVKSFVSSIFIEMNCFSKRDEIKT